MTSHEDWMRHCLDLGRIALAHGGAPVGTVIVKNGEAIAEGIEAVAAKHDPTAHAEIEAIRAACHQLNTLDLAGCVLYTNVEPCWMCSYAILQTGISEIYFGLRNTEVGGVSSKFAVLRDETVQQPRIQAELLLAECQTLRHEFQNK